MAQKRRQLEAEQRQQAAEREAAAQRQRRASKEFAQQQREVSWGGSVRADGVLMMRACVQHTALQHSHTTLRARFCRAPSTGRPAQGMIRHPRAHHARRYKSLIA